MRSLLLATALMLLLGCSVQAAPACPQGLYVMVGVACTDACAGRVSAVCSAADCSEIPYRSFADSGNVDEGGALNSASLDAIEISWALADLRCAPHGPAEFSLTDASIGERIVPFRIDGDRMITGSGVVWTRPSFELADRLAEALKRSH